MKILDDYLKLTGMTQAELSERTGITPPELNRIIKGETEPRVARIRKLSEVTGINIEKLIASIDPDSAGSVP